MDEINVVAESVLKVEIKQEPEFFLKTEPIELEEFISVKSEVKTEEDSEEELEPPAKVFVKSEEVVKEEVAEESEDTASFILCRAQIQGTMSGSHRGRGRKRGRGRPPKRGRVFRNQREKMLFRNRLSAHSNPRKGNRNFRSVL